MKIDFTRLLRFKDENGRVQYGEAGGDWEKDWRGQSIEVFDGLEPWDNDFKKSGKHAVVSNILSPLPHVPVIIGIGLNYRKHAEEAGFPIPSFPVVFTKYPDTLAGPYEDIPVCAKAKELDYEGELCIVMGKDAKNLSEREEPMDYVLGFAVGNDISSRYWQNAHRSGSQHGLAKSFDKFAPIGPFITSANGLKDPENLRIRTWVNGEMRQDGRTDDLIFGINDIIRYLSEGITLRKGTVIMTGTPRFAPWASTFSVLWTNGRSGVAAFHTPPKWLQNGDLVEVEIDEVGKIANKMVFES